MRRRQSVGKKAIVKAPLLKVAVASQYANCIDCKVNLKKWGPGGSCCGVLCPPCASERIVEDTKDRVAQEKHLAVLVTTDGIMREVDLKEESVSSLLGGGMTCGLYHSSSSHNDYPYIPYYTCNIRDNAINEKLDYNHMALSVARGLGGFDERSENSTFGNAVFTGPNGNSLYPDEVQFILRLE